VAPPGDDPNWQNDFVSPEQQPPQSFPQQPAPSPFPQQPPYQQGYPPPGYPQQPFPQQVPPFQQPPGFQYPYQQPSYIYGAQLPNHPSATTALVVSIVAIVGGFICGVPILAAPIAWIIGQRAVREIDAEPGRYGGRDQARAGQVLGIIGTVLLGLVVAFFFLLIIALSASAT
jgi:hypothetical protein